MAHIVLASLGSESPDVREGWAGADPGSASGVVRTTRREAYSPSVPPSLKSDRLSERTDRCLFPARTTHARNATRHALQRAAAIQPRALCGADQVCAPATIGAARGVLRRRRPAHGKRRVQCVTGGSCAPASKLLESFNLAKSLQCTYRHTFSARPLFIMRCHTHGIERI